MCRQRERYKAKENHIMHVSSFALCNTYYTFFFCVCERIICVACISMRSVCLKFSTFMRISKDGCWSREESRSSSTRYILLCGYNNIILCVCNIVYVAGLASRFYYILFILYRSVEVLFSFHLFTIHLCTYIHMRRA